VGKLVVGSARGYLNKQSNGIKEKSNGNVEQETGKGLIKECKMTTVEPTDEQTHRAFYPSYKGKGRQYRAPGRVNENR